MKRLRSNSLNIGWPWLNKLKTKILEFDIKPATPIVPELFAQSYKAGEELDYETSINCLTKILQVSPNNNQALLELGEKYFSIGSFALARKLFLRGIRYYPKDYKFYQYLGQLYAYTGKFKASICEYKRALELNPELENIRHLLNGAQQINTAIAPRSYIVDLFNDYASVFERSLIEILDYRAHIELADFLASKAILSQPLGSVLDLGCGTGLLGQELVQRFKPLTLEGVDLAIKMLEKCEQRQIYSTLHNMDLLEYLREHNRTYDLIGCSDVLVYLGDLSGLLGQAYQRLNFGGWFACSVEKLDAADDYHLSYNGRYKHSLSYITSLSNELGFNKIYSKAIDLRKEYGNIVAGYLVLLQK